MRSIDTIDLADLVPESIRNDPAVAAATEAINGELKAVSSLCMVPALYARIDELSSHTLDHLAWQVDSKVWRDSWPIQLKRSVIRGVIIEKSKRGTRAAVQDIIEAIGGTSVLKEWFEYDPPNPVHTFDILVYLNTISGTIPQERQADLLMSIDEVKPVRSHYTLSLATTADGGMGLQGIIRSSSYIRLELTEAPYLGGVGFQGSIRPVSYLRLETQEAE